MAIAQYKKKQKDYWQNQFRDSKKELWEALRSDYLGHLLNHAAEKDIILEGGCSAGRFLQGLELLGFKNVHGFEIDKKLYGLAKKKKLNVKRGNILDIPYKKNFADVFLDGGVIEHFDFKDQNKILKEINRVLKKEGILITGFAYLNTFRKIISPYLYLKNQYLRLNGWPFHQWIYTKRDMFRLLKKNGFRPLLFDHHVSPRAIIVAKKST